MTAKTDQGLTPPQEAFALAVAKGLSLAEAYRSAYPSSKKWKADSVHQSASRLMADAKVSARVAALRTVAADKAELDTAEIIREIRRVAISDIAGIMHPDGRVKLPHELDPATRAAVASFEIDEFGRIKYKFWDKNAALEKAAKIRGLFKEDNDQKAPLVGTVRLVPLAPIDKGES